ncbi:MAG: SCO family protein [Burkholderiaceae bacterium]|nr:SCO family protein [Burkholderiaceae bacterium]
MNKRYFLRSLCGGLLLASVLAACTADKPQFRSVDITGSDFARDFALTDADGQPRRLADFKGKLVVLFFGYTQCPDVCPTTMTELAEAKRLLGADGARVQGVFITVDPERDTPAVLKAYVANFDPSFVALHGTAEQIAAAAKEFKVYYKRVDGKVAGTYTMDHSAASFVFDAQGRVRLYARYGSGAQALAEDLRLLLK